MRVLGRLPIYAAGLGLTVSVAAVAAARDWSGWETLAAALAVGIFYVLTIVAPWLIREQVLGTHHPHERADGNGNGNHVSALLGSEEILVVPAADQWVTVTYGTNPVRHSEPRVTVR